MTDEELIEQVAELQLAAFLAGRGSVTGMKNGTRVAKPAPSMGDFRRMAQSAILPIIKAERIRGGEMVKGAALAKLDEDGSEIEAALTSEGIYVWGPDGERFERMFDVVMIGRRALSVPAIVEAGEHHPKENTDATSD